MTTSDRQSALQFLANTFGIELCEKDSLFFITLYSFVQVTHNSNLYKISLQIYFIQERSNMSTYESDSSQYSENSSNHCVKCHKMSKEIEFMKEQLKSMKSQLPKPKSTLNVSIEITSLFELIITISIVSMLLMLWYYFTHTI